MLAPEVIDELSIRLEKSESQCIPLRHFTIDYPEMTIEDAYAVQANWVGKKIAAGAQVRGHKVGLTSAVMQEGAGITEPDYGVLLDYMFYQSNDVINTDIFIAPRVEVELCFKLGKTLGGPGCTIFDVLDATDYVIPALEIIDTRFHRFDPETKAPRRIMDTIADNAANGAVVMGGRPIRPNDVDLRWVSAVLMRNEVIVESGVAAAVMNHPANGIVWLVNKLAQHGEVLQAGEVVLAGSFTRTVPIAAGEVYTADYGPLGTIVCRFA